MWRIFNMVQALNDFKTESQQIYGYSDDLAEALSLVTESVVGYYGEEYEFDIKKAVLSCEYKTASIANDKLPYSTLINGKFESTPDIDYSNGSYVISNIHKSITLPLKFNSNSNASIAQLLRLTLELVNSHLREYEINGSTLKQRQGLEQRTYSLSVNQSGEVLKEETMRTGYGLEEGLNIYSEMVIMREDYDDNYAPIGGSDYQRIIAGCLCDLYKYKEVLLSSSITGNYEVLADRFESARLSLNDLLSSIDELAKIEETRKNTTDSNEREALNGSLESCYENVAQTLQVLAQQLETPMTI